MSKSLLYHILGIICMALGSPGYLGSHWFLFVVVTAFIVTLIWVLVYLFSVREVLKLPINWIFTELLNTGIYAILLLTASIVELAGTLHGKFIAAGIFGLINMCAYGAGAWFLYGEYKGTQQ